MFFSWFFFFLEQIKPEIDCPHSSQFLTKENSYLNLHCIPIVGCIALDKGVPSTFAPIYIKFNISHMCSTYFFHQLPWGVTYPEYFQDHVRSTILWNGIYWNDRWHYLAEVPSLVLAFLFFFFIFSVLMFHFLACFPGYSSPLWMLSVIGLTFKRLFYFVKI